MNLEVLSQPLTPASPARYTPKGISAPTLFEQVKNTAPFLFSLPEFSRPEHRFISFWQKANPAQWTDFDSVADYYEVCLTAHFTTCATYVPTDVDLQIRHRLWQNIQNRNAFDRIIELVFESYKWDSTAISARWVRSPVSGEVVSGHSGEWFSVAVAAYSALKYRKLTDRAAEVAALVQGEVRREAQVFTDLRTARDGIGALKAATQIAHNLGDLDRVFEPWNIGDDDEFKKSVFKSGHEASPVGGPALAMAGMLNKTYMATESHRHFALRAAKPLRRSIDLLLPTAPFLDDWGARVAAHPALTPEDVAQVVEILIDGFERLHATGTPAIGYARALAGIESGFRGGQRALLEYVPSRIAKKLKTGLIRSLVSVPKERFESQWSQFGLKK